LLSSAGPDAFPLPAQQQSRMRLCYPALLASDLSTESLAEALNAAAGHTQQLGPRLTALASMRVLEEALRRAGRDLTRESLVASLESFQNFATVISPPITFSASRHSGVRGAYIVGILNSNFVPLSPWLNPEE
jgi:hypothetical protein